MKPILFGFPRFVVKATMVIIYVYIYARKLPSANYPPFSVTRHIYIFGNVKLGSIREHVIKPPHTRF